MYAIYIKLACMQYIHIFLNRCMDLYIQDLRMLLYTLCMEGAYVAAVMHMPTLTDIVQLHKTVHGTWLCMHVRI